jgi:hypothetical protein
MPGLSAASADVPAGESSEHLINGEPAGAGRLPRLAGWHDPFAAPAERFLLGQQVGSIASQRRASAPVTSGLLEDECISPCPGLCLGRYHTDRQPGDALQNTAK